MGTSILAGDVMALIYDRDTDTLLDAVTFDFIDSRDVKRLHKRIVKMMGGKVLEGGLGLGIQRRLLWSSSSVKKVTTYETRQDVIDGWLIGARGFEQHDPNDTPTTVFLGSVVDEIDREGKRADDKKKFDGIILSFLDHLFLDPSFARLLRNALPNPGQRLAVIGIDIPEVQGFNRYDGMEDDREDAYRIALFDRYDPSVGIGTEHPRTIHVPGKGFIRYEDSILADAIPNAPDPVIQPKVPPTPWTPPPPDISRDQITTDTLPLDGGSNEARRTK